MRVCYIILALLLGGWTFLDPVAKRNEAGNDLFEKGEYEKALGHYLEAQQKDPQRPELHFNAGDALYKQGKYEEAAKELTRVLETPKKDLASASYYNFGNTMFKLEKYEEAIGAYKKALEFNPDDLDTKINLEIALEKIKQEQEQEQQDKNKQQEPSEYAKKLKAQADALIEKYKFREAFELMQMGLKKDSTVGVYQDFINRTKDVVEIEG